MTKTKKQSGEVVSHEADTEEVAAPQPVVVPCVVGVNASHTMNTGEFSSVKVGVFLSVTVEPDDIDAAFEQVSDWVGEKMSEMIDAVEIEIEDADGDDD